MGKFIKFTEIKQFRNVVQDLKHQVQFIEFNEETQKPVYDWSIKMPKIIITGCEKIHGCLKFDTLITTKEYGDIPIKEIVDNKLKCNVLTRNLETEKNEWNLIENSWHSESNKNWMKITLDDDTELFLTEDHEVFNPKTKSYIQAKKLQINDHLLKK